MTRAIDEERLRLIDEDDSVREYERKLRPSFRLIFVNGFLNSLVYSITAPALYPYMEELSESANVKTLGWAIAVFSISRIILAPLFGIWSHYRRSKEPLIAANVMLILGGILYCYAASFPHGRQYVIVASRILCGGASGSSAVLISYLAETTTLHKRAKAMGRLRVSGTIGYVLGPSVQSVFTLIGYPGPVTNPLLHVNMFTLPMFLMISIALVNVVLYFTIFIETRILDAAMKLESKNYSAIAEERSSTSDRFVSSVYKSDYLAGFVCIFARVMYYFCLAEFDSLPTVLVQDMYAMPMKRAVFLVGASLSVMSLAMLALYPLLEISITKYRVQERKFAVGGLMFLLLGTALLIPFGHTYPKSILVTENTTLSTQVTTHPILHTTLYQTDSIQPTTANQSYVQGCNYSWCNSVPAIAPWQMVAGHLILIVVSAVVDLTSTILFTKVTSMNTQGPANGVMLSIGNLGALLAPLMLNNLYSDYGPRITFLAQFGVFLVPTVMSLLCFKRLVPLAER